ncbi:hypothetical protein DTO271G3_2253 [Paecilomyces variotii]|nr:hypothetical protein DTO271G3_2253 [Paecilomyces variotii]
MSLSNLHAPPPSGQNCSGVGSSASCDILFREALSNNTSFAGDIGILDQCLHVPQTLYGPSINTPAASTPLDQIGMSEWLGEHTIQHGLVEENSFADLPSMSYDNSASNNYTLNQIPTEAPPEEKDTNDATTDGNVPPRRQHRPGTGRTNSGHVKCRWEGCTYTGDFSRDTTLWRHIKAIHLFPDAFACRQCRRNFGRKDKYDKHMRDAH